MSEEEKKALQLKVVGISGIAIEDTDVREALTWVAEYPMMALLRKDGRPIPKAMDGDELVSSMERLGIRDLVGIMVLCAVTLRIMGRWRYTLEGMSVANSIAHTFAMAATTTGLSFPETEDGKWSVMQYVEKLNRLN